MATMPLTTVADIVSNVLHKTIKDELKQRFINSIVKDIEPILDEYTRQIVANVCEIKDPYSLDGIKVNIQFKLPELEV